MTTIPSGVNPGYDTGVRSGFDIAVIATKVCNAILAAGAAIVGGSINGTSVGATTPSTGAFTTLSASNSVTLSPASHNVVLSPTGTGVVTINPATLGTLDKVTVGGTTPAAGTFSLLVTSANTPANATATGVAGTIAWDATHVYVCVATNTWVRATTATW